MIVDAAGTESILEFVPQGSTVTSKIISLHNGNATFADAAWTKYITTWQSETVLTKVCNEEKDIYPHGYNGQRKTNETAGVGNHTTALYWECG